MRFNTLGVAGGNGVILHPFRKNLIGNIEIRPVFNTPDDIQWKLNFKAPLDKSSSTEYSKNLVDVIVGAPDCGHSSVLAYSRAKKLGNPKANKSLNLYFDTLEYYKPKFFLMENLPKLLETFPENLGIRGYRLIKYVKPVSVWGNSQVSRIRLVLIGIREDLPFDISHFPLPDPYYLKMSGELIRGLEKENPDICNVRESLDTYICLYYKNQKKITAATAQSLWLTQFKDLKKWPVNNGSLKNQPGIYRNFENEYPLTVRKQNRQFNHQGLMLTPREIARIQNIPDFFKLWYDPKNKNYSLNKARITTAKTPPYDIGLWFFNCLKNLP